MDAKKDSGTILPLEKAKRIILDEDDKVGVAISPKSGE
jgi:hypothetical protein